MKKYAVVLYPRDGYGGARAEGSTDWLVCAVALYAWAWVWADPWETVEIRRRDAQ